MVPEEELGEVIAASVEQSMIKLVGGEGSEARLAQAMLTHFPKPGEDISVETAFTRVSSMVGQKCYKLSSRQAQDKFKLVLKILKTYGGTWRYMGGI